MFRRVTEQISDAGEAYVLSQDVQAAVLAEIELNTVLDMTAIAADVILLAAAAGGVTLSPLGAGVLVAIAVGATYAAVAGELAEAGSLYFACREHRRSNCACTGSACVCAMVGSPCPGTGPALDSTCCGDSICVVGTCQPPRDDSGDWCAREQERCGDCCRGLACRPVGALDSPPTCCSRAGDPCNQPGDCCGLMECVEGRCQGGHRGDACLLGDCIGSSFCTDGLCV
ncbi:MAG: hypothetical protein AAGF12_29945 [Myxococcota bacterium]